MNTLLLLYIYVLALLFPPIALTFYIGFAQNSVTPEVIHIERKQWYQCFRLPSTTAPLFGLSLYNAASQTHFPDAIQFFTDPGAQCIGEPSLILTFSKRPGVYWIDLKGMHLAGVFTCWRYYDLQFNSLKLATLSPLSTRKGYEKGSIQDLVFRKDPASGNWMEVGKLKDVPNAPDTVVISETGEGHYPSDYIFKYGQPPEFIKKGEPNRVIPYIKEKLSEWSKAPIGVEETFPLLEQIPIVTEENIMRPEQVVENYVPGSLEYLRYISQRPTKPAESLPITQRMFEILRQNLQGKLDIPSPQTAFGLSNLKEGLGLPELVKEVGRLTADTESSDIELGWTLLRLAMLRDIEASPKKSVEPPKENNVPKRRGQKPKENSETVQVPKRKKKSSQLDLSALSNTDTSNELKINPVIEVSPIPIARNMGPGGATPPRRGSKTLQSESFGSEEEFDDNFERKLSRSRRQSLNKERQEQLPAFNPLEGFEPGVTVNDIREMDTHGFNILREEFSPFRDSQDGEEGKTDEQIKTQTRESRENQMEGSIKGNGDDKMVNTGEVEKMMGGTVQSIDLENIEDAQDFPYAEFINFSPSIENLLEKEIGSAEGFETSENQESRYPDFQYLQDEDS